MGLMSFLKGAGKKIFGNEEEEQRAAAADAANEAKAAEGARMLADRRRAAALAAEVSSFGFKVEDLAVKVSGDTATVSGTAANQAEREKIVLAIGNVHGISEVDDNLEVAEAEPEATFYTVQSGDSLSKIAKAHYGNAMKYPVIFEANKPMLSDPDKIYPGQVLRIPPIEG
jgi:nucleoid-associated protein YgaU